MDDIKVVNDLDPGKLYKIQLLLKEKRWYELLKASSIDRLEFSKYVQKTGNSKYVNLERTVLDYCANVPIEEFIRWLEAIHLEEALLLLKEDEPLKIIEEPERIVEVILGKDKMLTLSCKARGFPTPKYEWFLGRKKLSESAVLEISPIRFSNAGIYYCQVSNISRNGIKTLVFTSGTKVIVTPPQVSNLPEIVQQPYSPTTKKVYPGSTFTVTCKATSQYPLSYQWCCNSKILEGKVSPQLDITFHSNDVYEKKSIECIVSNKYGSVVSNSIILELESGDKECYAEDKVALLIGNSQYNHLTSLQHPAKDVSALSKLLQTIGFKTFCLQNLTCKEMRKALKIFSSFLRPGVYALFYFAGHGNQQSRRYSLLGKETKDITKDDSVCPEEILNIMQQQKPEANIVLLDACREFYSEPEERLSGDKFEHGLLGNTIIGYATSTSHSAFEIRGHSSVFVQYLKRHITECISVWDMLFEVIEDIKEDPAVSSLQYPYLEGSLTRSLKLTDSIVGHGELYEREMKRWKLIMGVPKKQTIPLMDLGINLIIAFSLYEDVFCNAMTINVYQSPIPGYQAEEYTVHIEFSNVDTLQDTNPLSEDSKMTPSFSISVFNLQSQEVIWSRMKLYHKQKKCLCYDERFCVVPAIAKAFANYT